MKTPKFASSFAIPCICRWVDDRPKNAPTVMTYGRLLTARRWGNVVCVRVAAVGRGGGLRLGQYRLGDHRCERGGDGADHLRRRGGRGPPGVGPACRVLSRGRGTALSGQ